jgi:hypothetical protein
MPVALKTSSARTRPGNRRSLYARTPGLLYAGSAADKIPARGRSAPVQTGFQLPAPARPLAMAFGPIMGAHSMAPDPVSAVAGWLTPASADVTDKPPITSVAVDDPVLALIAEGDRLDALYDAAQDRGDEIFNTLPEDIQKGRVRVSFSDSERGRGLSSLYGGYFTSEQQLQRCLDPWRRLQRRGAECHGESPEAAVAEFEGEIGLDQALAQLRAGLEEIKATREASGCMVHYREAEDLARRAGEVGNQISNTKPASLAGAIAMLERMHDAGSVDDDINPVIAGLRDMQPGGIADLAGNPRKCIESAEDWAALEFEAEDDPGIWEQFAGPAWEKESYHLGVNLRVAAMMLGVTKPQMVETLKGFLEEEGGEDTFPEALDCLYAAKQRCEALAEILNAAHLRQLVAASVLEVGSQEKPDVIGFGELDERP